MSININPSEDININTPRVEQTTGLDRDPIDKYYTKPTVAQECVKLMKKYAVPKKLCDIIIEPSAGNASFLSPLKSLLCPVRMYDIQPDHPQVIKCNYLDIHVDDMTSGRAPNGRIHVVGNPPFGRQSCLAIKFIKKTCTFADTISFILPKSFKKDSMRREFSQHFHLVHQSDLSEKSFLVNDKDHDSPCVFQIWVKQEHPRPNPIVYTPMHFFFVKRPDMADTKEGKSPIIPHAAIRRVGVYAGKIIYTETPEEAISKNNQTHYFIRFLPEVCSTQQISKLVECLGEIVYDTDNTVGPRSVSKNEMTKAINDRISLENQNKNHKVDTVSCDSPIL